MRIETSLRVEGTLIADFINQCKIDCGLKPIHRFMFSGSVSFIQHINWMWIETHVFPPKPKDMLIFIQYINWMWIETLAVLTEMSLLLFTSNIIIGCGLKLS